MFWKLSTFAVVFGLISGCGNSNFSGDAGRASGGGARPTPTLGTNTPLAPQLGETSPANTLDVDGDGNLNNCPSKPQSVLILDFKSGWWSGDGGNFVDRITDGLAKACSTKVTLEYHHVILSVKSLASIFFGSKDGNVPFANMQLTAPGDPKLRAGSTQFEQAFADPSFATYTQIWLLSGSSADPADLQVNHPFFQKVVQAMKGSQAHFFIGVGYGSITHAVAVAEALQLGASFSTIQAEGNILNPMGNISLNKSLAPGQFDSSQVMLKGFTSIADSLVVSGVPAHGDAIQDKGGVHIIATDNLNQPSLAVSKEGSAGPRFVLDGDLPRYYAAWSNQSPETMKLLQNILVYLAK
ncbi:MAG: hypothetical protein NTY08_13625 [Proteobacteria bacterium]|nr:hypothetical protein [Pseudomonadota bacterium]